MKNPLYKRIIPQLKDEAGKYIAIVLLMVFTIGVCSGFKSASGSMITTYNNSFWNYNIEDGKFTLAAKANKAQIKAIEEAGVKIYNNFYVERPLTNSSTMRIFQKRTEVDLECLMEGKFPETPGEIAIDRMYAENNNLSLGDIITDGEKSWQIVGLVALSDYSCLFQNNSDAMFDSIKFGVGIVTRAEFATFDREQVTYSYAWKYNTPPADKAGEKEAADDLLKVVNRECHLTDYTPGYLNQAIHFTGDDMGGDSVMMDALLYIVVGIMAFIFAVTTSDTISKESSVIGTLKAMGYTSREIIMHYLAPTVVITAVSSVVGNILGYTYFANFCSGLYYQSYSLPTFLPRFNLSALLQTTALPVVLMFVINYGLLASKLKYSPLKFLRRDISGKKSKRAFYLSRKIPFFSRFGIRTVYQNLSNYLMLFVGIIFANLLLLFGLIFPSIMNYYTDRVSENMIADYRYMLTIPVERTNEENKLESTINMLKFANEVRTENKDREKFSAYGLLAADSEFDGEPVTLYGIEKNSKYVDLNLQPEDVYISSAYRDKFLIGEGDTIVLREEYEDKTYALKVTGVYDYDGRIRVFADIDSLNDWFDLGEGYFCGYFSSSPIEDIDEKYIGTVIDIVALTKISRQLLTSMGGMMNLINGFSVAMFAVVVYILSKVIIDKNANSISMTKVLGYSNKEIAKLYIIPTTVMVVLFILISLPIENYIMYYIFREVLLTQISGYIPYYLDPVIPAQMFCYGLGTYLVVAIMEYRKIKNVPMNEALKNVE